MTSRFLKISLVLLALSSSFASSLRAAKAGITLLLWDSSEAAILVRNWDNTAAVAPHLHEAVLLEGMSQPCDTASAATRSRITIRSISKTQIVYFKDDVEYRRSPGVPQTRCEQVVAMRALIALRDLMVKALDSPSTPDAGYPASLEEALRRVERDAEEPRFGATAAAVVRTYQRTTAVRGLTVRVVAAARNSFHARAVFRSGSCDLAASFDAQWLRERRLPDHEEPFCTPFTPFPLPDL